MIKIRKLALAGIFVLSMGALSGFVVMTAPSADAHDPSVTFNSNGQDTFSWLSTTEVDTSNPWSAGLWAIDMEFLNSSNVVVRTASSEPDPAFEASISWPGYGHQVMFDGKLHTKGTFSALPNKLKTGIVSARYKYRGQTSVLDTYHQPVVLDATTTGYSSTFSVP